MAKKTTARAKSETKAEAAAPAPAAPKPRAKAKTTKAAATKSAPAAPEATQVSAAEPSDEDIRVRAYHRYLERGGGHGMDFEDWLEAKRELQGK
ncbi:MAG: DUF2934 domain-containing protein [Vicinamibacterales bacterium]